MLSPLNGLRTAASPGLKAGRGLKQGLAGHQVAIPRASPGLKAGRGLKLPGHAGDEFCSAASPGLKAGRGLKHAWRVSPLAECVLRPASKPGAD